MKSHANLRRLLEAAKKDKQPQRFWNDIEKGFRDGELRGSDFSIRSLFENFVPDGRELVAAMDPRNGSPPRDMLVSTLMEADAVATSDFSNISGQIVYNEVLNGFENEAFTVSALIPTVSTQFSGEKIAGVTRLGDDSQIVGEGEPYPMVGVGEDWITTAETLKRGMIVPLTRESIFFDRTGQLLSQAREVGESLGISKEKRAVDCLVDENRTAHRYNRKNDGAIATYGQNSGTHDFDNLNVSATLTDYTDVDAAEQTLNAITDPNTGEPVVVMATHLACAKELENTARSILNATEIRETTASSIVTINQGNRIPNAYELLTSRFMAARMTTDTSWYLGDPRRAFRYMENFPLSTSQAPPNSELEFTHDIAMRFKSSERGEYATTEPRAMIKSIVATA